MSSGSFAQKTEPVFSLKCYVLNRVTQEGIEEAQITVSANDADSLQCATDSNGVCVFPIGSLVPTTKYRILVEKDRYLTAVAYVETSDSINRQYVYEFLLNEPSVPLHKFPHITFYDSRLAPEGREALDKVFEILVANPTVVMQITSHTDCRGNDAYNKALSTRRAKSCVQYLISRGINPERILAKGVGEEQPLPGHSCDEISNMTSDDEKEDAHQRNRRTEIKVLSFDFDGKDSIPEQEADPKPAPQSKTGNPPGGIEYDFD